MNLRDRLGLRPAQAATAWVLVAAIGGFSGVFAMLLCAYLISFGGEDEANKHGISSVDAFRVGGVAIVAYVFLYVLYQTQGGRVDLAALNWALIIPAMAFFFVGLYEDLYASLSSARRFSLMLVIGVGVLSLYPQLILTGSGVVAVDWLTSTALSAIVFTAICLAFIPNAFNTADGANGLLSGVTVLALFGLSFAVPEADALLVRTVIVGTLVFMVFNLISGRFFLGDGGAYFLGALCGGVLIVTANQTDVSTWWMLSLIFYPVADLIWSIGRRALTGASPLAPDNQHFHNLVFSLLREGDARAKMANTVTGIAIAMGFSGIPLALQLLSVIPKTGDGWLLVVLVQWVAYGLGWYLLSQRVCSLPDVSQT